MAPSIALPRSYARAVFSPPLGYTVRIEENAGVQRYRAVRVNGPEWICPRLRGSYCAAEADAYLHSSGFGVLPAGGAI